MRKHGLFDELSGNSFRGELEIGQLLHFKTESRNFKMDGSNLRFRLSVLKCRIRPISNSSCSAEAKATASGKATAEAKKSNTND